MKPTASRYLLSSLGNVLVEQVTPLVLLQLNGFEERLEVTRSEALKGERLLVPLDGALHLQIRLVAHAVVEEVQTDLR
ncbi:hypothetical protein PMAYCL1PPCAC_11124 [Pristionchus mayeri]|uniref:Uncharacterized protein n=1 Tax=Pristionchus mayeri TaxID=1317129 RepID=A0AAN4ZJC7_9BILA|nr:hypothetical protein PMAYCL1PPCAC_11124 [Pristionchus mayeri]